MNKKNKCRISGQEMTEVFSLGNLQMSDFIPEGQAPRAGTGELKLMLCPKSGLLQLESIIPPEEMYGKYWYRSGINHTMKQKLKNVVDSCLDSIDTKKGDVFLDIACNDGTMFDYIPDYMIKIGIDPADDSYKIESSQKADAIVQDFFSAKAYKTTKYANLKPKIITTIAMFYDLDDPQPFVEDVYKILDDDGIWVLQLSYAPLMLKQLAFDNICHEHICYYSLSSMKYLMDRVGFDIVDCKLNDVNGGSFRIYLMKKTANKTKFRNQQERDVALFRVNSILEYEKSLKLNEPQTYINFYDQICNLRENTISFIRKQKAMGKRIAAYGASTKGNTLLQWYGLDNKDIDYIAERSSYKLGLKTAGTKIPIVTEKFMREDHPDFLLVLPWHFINEFAERESEYIKKGGKFIVPCPKFLIYPDEGK
tara:strand:+ start:463 stop:1731 length:1269 start_codon:yes stop_codon:yes gene_type:complete